MTQLSRFDLSESPEWLGYTRQIWTGMSNRGLEVHFALVNKDGAVCFRTGGWITAMRIHHRAEPKDKKVRYHGMCPMLDAECWLEKVPDRYVKSAMQDFCDYGGSALFGHLRRVHEMTFRE